MFYMEVIFLIFLVQASLPIYNTNFTHWAIIEYLGLYADLFAFPSSAALGFLIPLSSCIYVSSKT
jgi:hypothetical protein